MSELMILKLYKLCKSCDLDSLIKEFGNLSDPIDKTNKEYFNNNGSIFNLTLWNSNFDYEDFDSITYYAFYKAWSSTLCKNINRPILDWLQKLNPEIYPDNVIEDYTIDEILPNEALFSACKFGHYKVVKWLLNEEYYLSSFKNRCNICDLFIVSCINNNLGIIKMIFNLLPEYINERSTIFEAAYINAEKNNHVIEWLLRINPSKLYIIKEKNKKLKKEQKMNKNE